MAHADVKAALSAGIAAINAWAAGEEHKIVAAKAAAVSGDAGVASAAAELKGLHIDDRTPQKYFGQQVLIRNAHGKHLQMRDNDTIDHHSNTGGWEKWLIEDGGDGRVFLTSVAFKGKRVQAMDNKTVVRVHTNSGNWEKWTIVEAPGGKVMFRSHFGAQLSQDDHGKTSQSPNTAGWEQFEIIFVDQARVTHAAEVTRRLHAAEAAARSHADSAEASQRASLRAEVERRIREKNEGAARIDGEIARLAVL